LKDIFPMNEKIAIREMTESDCAGITDAFAAQGWNKPTSQYLKYWRESLEGKRVILIAELAGQFAGYVTIVWESQYPPFRQAGIPEIVDFNVLKKYQRMKIGTALMDEAEKRIAVRSPEAGLGVCIFVDYGPAQVLYARRGYVPDGRGAYQEGRYPLYGEQVTIGDDLVLYMTRQLRVE
jgi:GNAT superfamily N-acetyltransferase